MKSNGSALRLTAGLRVSVLLDEPTRNRSRAVRKRLSNERPEATDSETYRMLLLVGFVAVEALERKGRSLVDATLAGPPQKREGKHKKDVTFHVDTLMESRIENVRSKLSVEWREATRSDAIRLLLLLGLLHAEQIAEKKLERKLPELSVAKPRRHRLAS